MNGLFIVLIFIILLFCWNVYEQYTISAKGQSAKTAVQGKISESTKPKIVLYDREPCERPKVRHRVTKHARPKLKQTPPVKTVVAAAPVIPTAPSAVSETTESKPVISSTDPDYGKTTVEFNPLPEKESSPKRRVVVVSPSPYYYGGGYYNTGYQYPYYYSPVVTPVTQVITPAPIVTPAPPVVRPPSVVTGPAGPGVITQRPPSVVTR